MVDPSVVACTVDTWVKVATNVTAGYVWILDSAPTSYLQTYRDTGGAAPTNDNDAVLFPPPGMPISASAGIDVYIKARGVAGSVRVDV
jgi:hypothetical protein